MGKAKTKHKEPKELDVTGEIAKLLKLLTDFGDIQISDVRDHPLFPYSYLVGNVKVAETILEFRLPIRQ